MPYQKIIDDLYLKYQDFKNKGKVASYIPELKKVDSNMFTINFNNLKTSILEQESLNKKGNSFLGFKVLEEFISITQTSIF